MKLAVNTRFLLDGLMEGFGVYTDEIMRRIVRDHDNDEFHFYFDRPFSTNFRYAGNVALHRVGPPARHPVLYYAWYQLGLRRKLQALNPDVFFSPDAYMPLGMRIPSVITVHDVAPMRFPEDISRWQRWYYRHYVPRFIAHANHIITVSQFSKTEIMRYFQVEESKISVVYNGVGEQFKPGVEDPKIREHYSRSKPFFLYVGAIHPRKNVVTLLRAFDHFKQQFQSDARLVIAGRFSWKGGAVRKIMETIDSGDAVDMHGYVPVEDLPGLIRNAIALVYVSRYEGFGMPVVEAMACGTPVITSNEGALAEVAGKAALLVDPVEVEQIAHAMHDVCETGIRRDLIASGLQRAAQYRWDIAANGTYDILKAQI